MNPSVCRFSPLGLLALLALSGCGAHPPLVPRSLFPLAGEVALEPPARGGGFTVERLDVRPAPGGLDPRTMRQPQNLWIEIRAREAGTVRAEDFSLIRTPLAEFELSAGDDLAPRPATGLAAGPKDSLTGARTVTADGRVWLSFSAVELRALNAAGGHPVPLTLVLRHADGAEWILSDPARGLPEWRPVPDRFALHMALGMYAGDGPGARDASGPFGGEPGGDSLGAGYEAGLTAGFGPAFVKLSGGFRAGARTVFADEATGRDPRLDALQSLELNGTLLGGWRGRLPPVNGMALGFRLGIGWHVASVYDKTTPEPDGGPGSLGVVHALPIEMALTVWDVRPVLPVAEAQGKAGFGLFIRLEPRLGALSGDARYGEGVSFFSGLEWSGG